MKRLQLFAAVAAGALLLAGCTGWGFPMAYGGHHGGYHMGWNGGHMGGFGTGGDMPTAPATPATTQPCPQDENRQDREPAC